MDYTGPTGEVQSLSHTDVLWEVILDTGVVRVKALQNRKPLVYMIPFGSLLVAVLASCACVMIWEAGGLEFVT